ncbi:MAG TPA: DUF3300 domain-containing protein [Deltaproteobacteria bacterium]|nr:DUF3300 domain-containing protein [Deltaproteobacteria bacterium]
MVESNQAREEQRNPDLSLLSTVNKRPAIHEEQHQRAFRRDTMKVPHIKKIITVMLLSVFLLPWSMEARAHTIYIDEELSRLLAPIALYPDPLLSQVLMAATYPSEVSEADRWLTGNAYLTDESLDAALRGKDWDVSILSLCYYPKVLSMMNNNLDWTTELGNAFIYQQEDVMDTIQDLRSRARFEGNLVSTTEQKVIVEQKIIRIEPASPYYLYVPVYDPLFVYGSWWYPSYPPFRVFYPGVSVIRPRIVFSAALHAGFGVIGWSLFDWPSRSIAIVNIDITKRFNRHYHVYHSPRKVHWKPVPGKLAPRSSLPARNIVPSPPPSKKRSVITPSRTPVTRTRPIPSRIEREPSRTGTPDRTVFSRGGTVPEHKTVIKPGRHEPSTKSATPGNGARRTPVLKNISDNVRKSIERPGPREPLTKSEPPDNKTRDGLLKNISDNVRKSIEKPGAPATGTKRSAPSTRISERLEPTSKTPVPHVINGGGMRPRQTKSTSTDVPGIRGTNKNSTDNRSHFSTGKGNPRSKSQYGGAPAATTNRSRAH